MDCPQSRIAGSRDHVAAGKGDTTVTQNCGRGFTLIEVLVVVAVIALLIAILMPSLSRAKAMSRNVQCQSNMKQLATAFAAYVTENKGRLPGSDDYDADWLGHYNISKGARRGLPNGRNPDDGTIFKHMGKNKLAYCCPDDDRPRQNSIDPEDSKYSYTSNKLIVGAPVEMLADAHYRRSPDPNDTNNYHPTNHTANMRPFGGVPILVEEDPDYYLIDQNINDSAWCNEDNLANRHLPGGGNPGSGNMAFHDTHVARMQLLSRACVKGAQRYFRANTMCIRTRGRKWISGHGWPGATYGYLTSAEPASAHEVIH